MDEQLSLLVVDDETSVLDSIQDYFFSDYRIEVFSDPLEALKSCKEKPFDILLTDHRMPGLSGFELLLEAKKHRAYSCGIMLTAYADKDLLIQMVNRKLLQFILEKPIDLELLGRTLKEAETYILALRESPLESDEAVLIGMEGDLFPAAQILRLAAPTGENILITGETGTGKELIARRIHLDSPRRQGPFIKINCAAIPEHLLESELFGYARGAFTGAGKDKPGKIEAAEKGTLFLDEIAEMKPDLQSKLLSVLQDRKVERLGSTSSRPVDFRLLTATNKIIETLVRQHLFRDDLYYRLNTVRIHLPPLRERQRDLSELISVFLKRFGREFDRPGLGLTEEAAGILKRYPWPGNIRELENALKRAVILLDPEKRLIAEEDLKFLESYSSPGNEQSTDFLQQLVDRIENREISIDDIQEQVLRELLRRYKGDIPLIVRRTDIPRDRLYRLKRRGKD